MKQGAANSGDRFRSSGSEYEPELVPAGFWLRFFASTLDTSLYALFAALLTVLLLALYTPEPVTLMEIQDPKLLRAKLATVVALGGVGIFILSLFGLFYFPIFEASPLRATPGKLLLGLVVGDYDMERIRFGRACLRNGYKMVPFLFIPAALLAALGVSAVAPPLAIIVPFIAFGAVLLATMLAFFMFLSIAFSTYKQGLHDKWSKCFVLKRTSYPQPIRWGFAGVAVLILVAGATSEVDPQLFRFNPVQEERLVSVEDGQDVPREEEKVELARDDSSSEEPAPWPEEEPDGENVLEKQEPAVSQEQKDSFNRIESAGSIERSLGVLGRTPVPTSIPPVTTESVSGTVSIGKRSLPISSLSVRHRLKGIHSQLTLTAFSPKAKSPVIQIVALYRGTNHGCSKKRLVGYQVNLGLRAFGAKTGKSFTSLERRGDDVILGERLGLECDREVNRWIRGSPKGSEAILLRGTRYSIAWELDFEKKL